MLVALDWQPASQRDLGETDTRVIELVLEIRRGNRDREEAKTEKPGPKIASYGPEDHEAKP